MNLNTEELGKKMGRLKCAATWKGGFKANRPATDRHSYIDMCIYIWHHLGQSNQA